MTEYELHVYGGDNVEEERRRFDTLGRAVGAAESMATDNTDGWEFLEDGLRLVDHNASGLVKDTAIHVVTEVEA